MNDGGSAYPQQRYDDGVKYDHHGLTVRQAYKIAALPLFKNKEMPAEAFAKGCANLADALIREDQIFTRKTQ